MKLPRLARWWCASVLWLAAAWMMAVTVGFVAHILVLGFDWGWGWAGVDLWWIRWIR